MVGVKRKTCKHRVLDSCSPSSLLFCVQLTADHTDVLARLEDMNTQYAKVCADLAGEWRFWKRSKLWRFWQRAQQRVECLEADKEVLVGSLDELTQAKEDLYLEHARVLAQKDIEHSEMLVLKNAELLEQQVILSL